MRVLKILKAENISGAEKHVHDIACHMNREGLGVGIINVVDESKGGLPLTTRAVLVASVERGSIFI